MNKSSEYSPENEDQSDILKQALVDILCDSNFDDEKGYLNIFHAEQENLKQNNVQQHVAMEGLGQQNDVNDTFTVGMNAQSICYLPESLNTDSKLYTISQNGSSVPSSHQLLQFKTFDENATATSLSMETIQDSRKLQSSVKSNHDLQNPFQGSQVTTPETSEQYATHNKKPIVTYHLVNNKNLIVKSNLKNAANIRSAHKNIIVNNNTTPITKGISNAFLLPKTQASIVNAPFSINLGVNSDSSINQIPNTTQKKNSKPTIRSNIKYKVPVSTIQGILGVHQNSVLKTSFQPSLLKTQSGKTVTNGLPNSQLTNKSEKKKKIPVCKVDKVRLDVDNKLGKQSPKGLKGVKVCAIKPKQPAISKSYSTIVPNSFGNLMPSNSPNPVEQHSQNVKIIVLQPSSQSGSVASNLVSLKDWPIENIANTHNVSFESTIEKLLTNHKAALGRPKSTAKRGRPRKDTVRPLVTECKQPVFDEDMDEFRERVTRCGRLSRPPPHIINDYKHNHPTSLIHPDVDDSNGDTLVEEASKELLPGLEGPKRNISDDFKCPTCKKIYLGRSKMAAHFEKNPTHGNVDQLPPPKLISLDSKKNNLKPKGKKRGPWVTPEEKSARRQINLQKAISVCDKNEILKIATKPVLEATSILDLMLVQSKNSAQNFFEVFNNFIKDVREKIVPDLRRMRDKDRGTANTIDLTQQFVCDAMGLSPGVYKYSNNFLEGEEPLQDEEPPLKKFKGLSEEEDEQHLLLDNRNLNEFSEGSDNSSNSNCVNYLSALPLMPRNSSPNNEVCKPIVISTPEIQAKLSENSGFKKIDISANFNNSFEKMSQSSQSLPIFSTLGCDFKSVAETLINETELESENSESYQTIEDDYIFTNVENSIGNMIGVDTFTSDFKRSYNNVESGVNNNSMVKIF